MRILIMLISMYFVFALDRDKASSLDLPDEVEQSFDQQYSGVVGEIWASEDSNYVVLFEWQDGVYEAEYNAAGEQLKLMAIKEPPKDSGMKVLQPQRALYTTDEADVKDCSVKCPVGL